MVLSADPRRVVECKDARVDRYQVELVAIPADELRFVKTMRMVGRMSLPDALDVFDAVRAGRVAVLVAGLEQGVASQIAGAFAASAIEVRVEPSTLNTPMVCRPILDDAFAWHLHVVPKR